MRIDWEDLGAGFAIYLVLEGLLPFLRPSGVKLAFLAMTRLPDRTLRLMGLTSMVAGCLLLHLIRS